MPIYAYRCESCGVQFERHQSFDDEPLKVCPECDESALRKLIQPVGVVFRGSGFYVTDNRSAKNGSLRTTGSDTDKESKSSESDSAKQEKSKVTESAEE
jgi:putative FmdB family regulatory protein